jgi:hypothetical protein
MHPELHAFYENLSEPQRSTFLALRELILAFNADLTQEWKYRLPFFYLQGKMFCYLWMDKKTGAPYVGIANGGKIEHPALQKGDRARMKIFPVDPEQDIPIEELEEVLAMAVAVHPV